MTGPVWAPLVDQLWTWLDCLPQPALPEGEASTLSRKALRRDQLDLARRGAAEWRRQIGPSYLQALGS